MAGLNRVRIAKPERPEALPLSIDNYRIPDDVLQRMLPRHDLVRHELIKGGRYLAVSVRWDYGRTGRTVEVKTTGRRPEPGNPGKLIPFAMPRDYDRAIEMLKGELRGE